MIKAVNGPAFESKGFEQQATARLQAAFQRSLHPPLIADDQRRWVTANTAACELLGIAQEEVSWHTMDDFTPPGRTAEARTPMGVFSEQR